MRRLSIEEHKNSPAYQIWKMLQPNLYENDWQEAPAIRGT